jgi:hypothetical protein
MGYDLNDAAADDFAAEQYMEQLYQEHKLEALEEFTSERLQSFYLKHPDLVQPALRALADARNLQAIHAGAAWVFGAVAMELGIRSVLLKPVVYGLVHQDSVASLITDLVMSHAAFDRFGHLLFQVLANHGGVDLRTAKRPGSTILLWAEMSSVQKRRNAVLHRGEQATGDDATLSIEVASTILDGLIPSALHRLGMHLHGGVRVCSNPICRVATPDARVV